jgi:hypothetical protein
LRFSHVNFAPANKKKNATTVTEGERKERGEKSAVIVERLDRAQLRAMGCERFELGIRRDTGEMILREGQTAIDIEQAVKWLRHENAKGAHIYVRPAGRHALSLRLERAAAAIGDPQRIIAATDCGFETTVGLSTVAEEVVWAKLRALRDGAAIASQRLLG